MRMIDIGQRMASKREMDRDQYDGNRVDQKTQWPRQLLQKPEDDGEQAG